MKESADNRQKTEKQEKKKPLLGQRLKQERERRSLTQAEVAEMIESEVRSVRRWESGERAPQPSYLRKLVQLYGISLEELGLILEAANTDAGGVTTVSTSHEDWGEAPSIKDLYGREKELALLKQWVGVDHCRVVAVLGIGGIGKTALTVKLAEQIKSEFDYIIWHSLQNAPPLEQILRSCIQFLSNQQHLDLPQERDSQITLLVEYLRQHRCLLILDNIESILRAAGRAGQYREGYEDYAELICRIGEVMHQSCLVLTSREKLKEVVRLEGTTTPVRSLSLSGIGQFAGQELLKNRGLFGSNEEWADLVARYSGNPLALQLVSEPIQEVFGGNIARFLQENISAFGDISNLLEQHFHRLSDEEREIMYWLAIEREVVSLDGLREDLAQLLPAGTLPEILDSLRRRSMIEIRGSAHFTLQPVIMEYVTDHLVERASQEFFAETTSIWMSHALIKAQAKDYIRSSQARLILAPVAERLLNTMEKEEVEKKSKKMLSTLRETHPRKQGYAAGNMLNLLIYLRTDLRGYDFSQLRIRQAYLQDVALPDVNFAEADLATSVFTDTFSSVLTIALSPDGKLLAAGTTNGEIRLWHVTSGTLLFTFLGHTDWVYSIAFHADGKLLASGSDDQTVRLWDISSGQCLKTLQGHTRRIYSIAFSPDRKLLASGSEDRTIRLWDVGSGQCLKTLQGHSGRVRSIAFSPDGSVLASGSEDRTIRLWDVGSGQCLKTLQGHTDQVWSVAFSPDGKLLASGSEDQTIRLWDVGTSKHLFTIQGHTNWVRVVVFSPDGNVLASGSEDRTIRLWDVRSGQSLRTVQGYSNWIRSVSFSPNGKLLASGGEDRTVHLWDVNSAQHLKTLQGHSDWIWLVAFSPDGRVLASGSEDRTIRLWDVGSGQCLKTLQGHSGRVRSVAFSPDGSVLASGGDETIKLWSPYTGELLRTLTGHSGYLVSIVFSPDGSLLASGSEDRTIRLWDVSSGQHLKTLQGHNGRIYSVTFSPDGSLLASGSEDRTIRLWDVSSGQHLKTLQGHQTWVWSVVFSPDGSILASGSDDQTVCLWDVSSGQHLKTLQGHNDHVRSVAFSPDGKLLASGSADGTIKLWIVLNGECLKTLRSERPYENMNITGVRGLTDAQKATLRLLGAVDN